MIVLGAAAVFAAVILTVIVTVRHRRNASRAPRPVTSTVEVDPVSGLEHALDQVAAGTSGTVDRLRDSDDTGPMLRRALDLVANGETVDDPADPTHPPAPGSDDGPSAADRPG